jgi:UDP-N-acetylmuramoylalanine--D-glutamate ligase
MKKIAILGAGESGTGAALLAKAKGYEVFLSDKGPIKDQYKIVLEENQIKFEERQHTEATILDADEVIKSPGIPDKAELIVKLKALKKPIISEIEFASRYTSAKLIAITGSNGKTTTTLLTYHLLKNAGLNVGLAGNIGESFAKQVINDTYDYFVLELSSFQLDNMYQFKADIAMILNITPDHLDRYNYEFENYIQSKFRITQNLTSNETLVYFNESLPIVNELAKRQVTFKTQAISLSNSSGDVYFENGQIITKQNSYKTETYPLQGPHNTINMMCAIRCAELVGIDKASIEKGLESFLNAPHRLEKVRVHKGITYINDSKATNVDSVYYALGSFKENVILIMGGVDKGNDYTQIEEQVKQKVKALICMGVDNSPLVNFFDGKVNQLVSTNSLADAMDACAKIAKTGDTVLLSPACASFDLFKNYEDRGDQFRKLTLAIQ